MNTGKKRGPKPKLRPQELPEMNGPGVGQVNVPEIDRAAERYVEARDERMAMTPKEVEAKKKLLELMKKHQLRVYRFDDRIVEIVHKDEAVKVKKADEPEGEGGED